MSETAVEKACAVATKNGDRLLFAGTVEKFHETSNGHAPRIVVATTYSLQYFDPKKITPKQVGLWLDITDFEFDRKSNIVEICFNEKKGQLKMKFQTDKATEFVKSVVSYLCRIIVPSIATECGISTIPDFKPKYGNVASSVVHRYSLLSKKNNTEQVCFDQITKSAKYQERYVVFPDNHGNDASIGAYQVDPYVEELEFPNYEDYDPYVQAGDAPHKYLPFKHVIFNTEFKPTLIETMKKFGSSNNFITNAFTFRNTKMNEKDVEEFSLNANFKKIESWVFDNAFEAEGYEKFISSFFKAEIVSPIRTLQINSTENVKVSEVLELIPDVQIVGFINDNLNATEAMKEIAEAKLEELDGFSLAGNKFTEEEIGEDIALEKTISLIDISNCEFSEGALLSTIKFIFRTKFENAVTIYAENIKASEEDIKAAIKYISSLSNIPIRGLKWSKNKVTSEFIEMIGKMKYLQELYIDGCFTEGDAKEAENLGNALTALKIFKKVSVTGSEDNKAKAALIPFINKIKGVKTLEWLDVSNQEIADDGLKALSEVIASTNVNMICFDNSKPTQASSIDAIIEEATKRGKRIVVSYPVCDAEAVAADESKLIAALNVLSQRDVEAYVAEDPFTHPFDIFVHQCKYEAQFPEFLSKAAIELFENAKPTKEIDDNINELYHIKKEEPAKEEESKKEEKKKKQKQEETTEDSFVYEDPEIRIVNQEKFRNFYENVELSSSSEEDEDDKKYDENYHPEPKMINEDGYVEPVWNFNPDLFISFDASGQISKLNNTFEAVKLSKEIEKGK